MASRTKVKIIELDENQKLKGKSIYLAVPAYGCLVHNAFCSSLFNMQIEGIKRGVPILTDFLGHESLIQRGRNMLLARFRKSQATHLLFIDSDIAWSHETVWRMLEFDKPIVSCAYPKKMHNFDQVVEKVLAGEHEAVQSIQSCGLDYNINITDSVSPDQGFVKVLDAATGFLLLSRELVEAVCNAHDPELRVVNDIISSRDDIPEYIDVFECIHDDIGQGKKRLLSEDYSFSRKCQRLGYDVWMDVASIIAHNGNSMNVGDVRDRFPGLLTKAE